MEKASSRSKTGPPRKKTSLYVNTKQTSEAADILRTSSVASMKTTGARRADLDAQGPRATLSVADHALLQKKNKKKNGPQTRAHSPAS